MGEGIDSVTPLTDAARMRRMSLTVSDAMFARLSALAERDAPGAPNLTATAVRMIAGGLRTEYREETDRIVREVQALETYRECAPSTAVASERAA